MNTLEAFNKWLDNTSFYEYEKGKEKTRDVVPTNKNKIGVGAFGEVYEFDWEKLMKENSAVAKLLQKEKPLAVKNAIYFQRKKKKRKACQKRI